MGSGGGTKEWRMEGSWDRGAWRGKGQGGEGDIRGAGEKRRYGEEELKKEGNIKGRWI